MYYEEEAVNEQVTQKTVDSPLTILLKSPQKNAPVVQSNVPPAQSSTLFPILPAISAGTDTRPIITMQNTVSTLDLCCPLDLIKLSVRTRNSEYNPRRFRGCVMRILEPKSTALIFHTGKIVVTGARNVEASHLAARKFARIIQKVGFPVKPTQFRVCNVVGTCDLRFPIKVDALNQVHAQFCSYEPELFPAVVYRVVKPRVVLLIFVNGKIVMTGAKSKEEMYEALDFMLPILRSFRKQ